LDMCPHEIVADRRPRHEVSPRVSEGVLSRVKNRNAAVQ